MSLDIAEILEKLKSIEGFANKVAETKKLADQLAENFARMKMSINQTINDSFTEIANQIDTLRKNMEQMESVNATAPKVDTPDPTPAPLPEPIPTPAPEVVPEPTPTADPTPTPEPVPTPTPEAAPVVAETPPEGSDQLDFLLQQKDRLKAALTDLRFDYMRGYLPESEYKTKEAELDSQLEEMDQQINALK